MRTFPGVQEETTTTGTGTITLTEVTGRARFSEAYSDGDQLPYVIEDGDNFEVGIGTYTASNQLARSKILATLVSGTYDVSSPTAITLAAGTKTVSVTDVALMPGEGAVPDSMTQHYYGYHNSALTTDLLSKDRALYRRFHLRTWDTWAGLVVQVTSAAPASTNARMAIYTCGTDGEPDRRIDQTAEFAVDTTGTKEVAFSGGNLSLVPGDYYVAFVCEDNVTVVTNTKNDDAQQGMGSFGSLDTPISHMYESVSAGTNALPANAAASLTGVSGNDPVLVGLYK